MNFINNAEMAALVDAGMAETEVTKTTVDDVTTTTIYAGAPYRRTVCDQTAFCLRSGSDQRSGNGVRRDHTGG